MKKDKKDTAELLGQIEYDEAATSAINADMAVLLALSALELIAGFFMNGYSVIADGLHLHPDVLRIAALCKGAKGMALISDSMEAAGMSDGQYDLGGQAVFVRNGEARLADGVIAGSTLVLHRAVRNMIRLAQIAPETVIPMATSTPADSIGAKGYGRIQPGACGVLTLMDADWNLAGVIA